MSVSLLVAGDVRLYRDGLTESLVRRPGLTVIASVASRAEAVSSARHHLPDVVLLDIAMAGSIETIADLRALEHAPKVVALGVREVEAEVLACVEAGVAGYVPRSGSLADLVAAIESARRGEFHCPPRMTAALLRRLAALASGARRHALPLTRREQEILKLIDDGLSNKEIAGQLCIELATVKNHVHNILDKLRVRRRGQAAASLRSHDPAWASRAFEHAR